MGRGRAVGDQGCRAEDTSSGCREQRYDTPTTVFDTMAGRTDCNGILETTATRTRSQGNRSQEEIYEKGDDDGPKGYEEQGNKETTS